MFYKISPRLPRLDDLNKYVLTVCSYTLRAVSLLESEVDYLSWDAKGRDLLETLRGEKREGGG